MPGNGLLTGTPQIILTEERIMTTLRARQRGICELPVEVPGFVRTITAPLTSLVFVARVLQGTHLIICWLPLR